jgi:hypothetical protein
LLALAKQAPVVEVAPEPKPDIYPLYDEHYLMTMPPVEWMIDGVLTKHGFSGHVWRTRHRQVVHSH